MLNKGLVLLSGGQDSTTCFHQALIQFREIEAISFDYGQRHRIELQLAEDTARRYDVPWTLLPVEALKTLAGGSLTNPDIENTPGGAVAPAGWHERHQLPPSFVPGRNLLFFSLAAAYAIPRDFNTIVTGVCAQDHAGYPDCRASFVHAMADAIREGMDSQGFSIHAPLLNRTKADTFMLADDLDVLDEIIENTSTCYEGDREHRHEWGYGCGKCGACVERERGYTEFRALVGA